jgi:hypothetical protein
MLSTTESLVPLAKDRSCESRNGSWSLAPLRLLSTGVASSKKVSDCLVRVSRARMPPLALNVLVEPVGVAGRDESRSRALPPKSAMLALLALQTLGMDEVGNGCLRAGILLGNHRGENSPKEASPIQIVGRGVREGCRIKSGWLRRHAQFPRGCRWWWYQASTAGPRGTIE